MARKKRDEEEIAATVAALPTEPPEGTVDTLLKRGLFKRDVLIYRAAMIYDPLQDRKRRMVHVHCTACGNETHLEYVKFEKGCHNSYFSDPFGFVDPADQNVKHSHSTCICPACGKGMEALHISRFHEVYEVDRCFCVTVHNVRGHLALLSWTVGKYARKNGEIFYVPRMWEGSLIVDRYFYRCCGYVNNMTAVCFYDRWKLRAKGFDGIADVTRVEIMDFSRKLVESTDSAYCALHEYVNAKELRGMDRFPGMYLQLWCTHPNIENLVRSGLTVYLNYLIRDCGGTHSGYCSARLRIGDISNYINFKEVKPYRMLGVDKCDLPYVKRYGYKVLERCKDLRDGYGICFDEKIFEAVNELGPDTFGYIFGDTDFKHHRYKIPIVHMMNYLMKQKEVHKNRASMIGLGYLRDYWDSVFKVYGRMERTLLYPKDLVKSHDEILKLIKDKEDAILNEGIQRRYEALQSMSFEEPTLGLLIRPVSSHAELISEGKLLSHCVARYAKDIANERTSIFLIRDMADPGKPYYTLEYHNGKILQDRGYQNCAKTPRIIEFENAWLAYIASLQACEKGCLNGK